MLVRGTPLCPAGHLPRKGGDQMSRTLSPISYVGGGTPSAELPISPLAGEMPGRAEGGVKEYSFRKEGVGALRPC